MEMPLPVFLKTGILMILVRFLGQQFAEVGILAVEHMLVEVGLVLGRVDIGEVVGVQVEVLLADVAPVLVQPAAVVLAFALGRGFVHGLQPLDADARVARRSETGVGQHGSRSGPR